MYTIADGFLRRCEVVGTFGNFAHVKLEGLEYPTIRDKSEISEDPKDLVPIVEAMIQRYKELKYELENRE